MSHPPLYLACTKRDTVKLAAELGVGALTLGFAGLDEIRLDDRDEVFRIGARGQRFSAEAVISHFRICH